MHHQSGELVESDAADDAHNDEKDCDTNCELEQCLFESAPRALNGLATTTKLTAECRSFCLEEEESDEHHRDDDHHDVDRDTHG